MATKADDQVETNLSSVDQVSHAQPETQQQLEMAEMKSSGDELGTTDDDMQHAHPLRTTGRTRARVSTYALDSVARVKANKQAKDAAVGKLLKSSDKLPTSKFIIVVNNMTDHDLVRTSSSGGDSWPFGSIQNNECVAALFDHSHFKNLNAVFTADDDKPGIRTVLLYAHWPLVGNRDIGIYAGKTTCAKSWHTINWQKIHDHELDGNQAVVTNPSTRYIFGYDINQLQYAQFGVNAHDNAATDAIERFTNFCIGSMPGFTFVVNNLTGYDLTLAEKEGNWPLNNIKKGECAVAGFDQVNMTTAACYTAHTEDIEQKSISLAGSWPLIGSRTIYIGERMKAKDAWKKLSKAAESQNWPLANEQDNSAYIVVTTGNSGKICIYIYVLRKM